MHILIKYFILTEIVITNLFYKIITVSLFHDYFLSSDCIPWQLVQMFLRCPSFVLDTPCEARVDVAQFVEVLSTGARGNLPVSSPHMNFCNGSTRLPFYFERFPGKPLPEHLGDNDSSMTETTSTTACILLLQGITTSKTH